MNAPGQQEALTGASRSPSPESVIKQSEMIAAPPPGEARSSQERLRTAGTFAVVGVTHGLLLIVTLSTNIPHELGALRWLTLISIAAVGAIFQLLFVNGSQLIGDVLAIPAALLMVFAYVEGPILIVASVGMRASVRTSWRVVGVVVIRTWIVLSGVGLGALLIDHLKYGTLPSPDDAYQSAAIILGALPSILALLYLRRSHSDVVHKRGSLRGEG